MDNMPDLATLAAPVTTKAHGVSTTTYPVITGTARCRLAQPTAAERIAAEREGEVVDAILRLPPETIIGHSWRVTVSGVYPLGGAWAESYDVVGVDAPQTNEIERRVRLRAHRTGSV
jgi:hypothetical protein